VSGASVIGIYSRSEAGHRQAYLDFVSSIFNARRVDRATALRFSRPVFFLMIEESFAFFVLASLWRALLGRRTIGLLFRPGPAVENRGLRHAVKRLILRLMKRISSIRVLTIVPFTIAPRFASIADDWIYDLQLWDLSEDGRDDLLPEHGSTVVEKVTAAAHGRPVIAALGVQDRNKGFDVFARTWSESPALKSRYLFAYGGRVAGELQPYAQALADNGGVGLNGRVSDDELFQFYAASHAVWCLYDKGYDQASGILGRAIQFGLPAIVREGSLSHRLCVAIGAPHVAASAETLEDQLHGTHLPPRDAALGARFGRQFRQESAGKLAHALGVELAQ
jgi:hypothetical protein